MNSTFKDRLAKMSTQEIMTAIQCVNSLGKLSDEELAKRGMKMEEPQHLNHFLNAVSNGQSTLLSEQAITLFRLTPTLLKNGNTTVHRILLLAAPKVIDSYAKAQTPAEKMRIGKVLKTAGLVCVDRRLKTAGLDIALRKKELENFKPFIGERPEYQEAVKRFYGAHKVLGFARAKNSFNQMPGAVAAKLNFSYPRGIEKEYE